VTNREIQPEIDGDERDLGDLIEFVVEPSSEGARLDRFVTERTPDLSRSYIQHLIENGLVLVDGEPRRPSFKVAVRQVVSVEIPPPVVEPLEPENIPLDIVYEDPDLIVLKKPAGMVVHPAPGNTSGTLVNALIYHAPEINVSGSNRPGLVHRLDKDTSGLMVVAKTDRAKESLLAQWQARTVLKEYIALVRGVVEPDEGTIDTPIARDPLDRKRMGVMAGGRDAITHFRVLERFSESTLMAVELETGRTHQIRVHFAFIGHPVVGDITYNRSSGRFGGKQSISPRQFLHASRLGFELPSGERRTFDANLPPDLQKVLENLEKRQLKVEVSPA
jgi:23S rRNA pseudouridine1911/1915/1917 synthase